MLRKNRIIQSLSLTKIRSAKSKILCLYYKLILWIVFLFSNWSKLKKVFLILNDCINIAYPVWKNPVLQCKTIKFCRQFIYTNLENIIRDRKEQATIVVIKPAMMVITQYRFHFSCLMTSFNIMEASIERMCLVLVSPVILL